MDSTQLGGTLLLPLIMIVVGMELTVADFRRVAAYPRAVVIGTLGQLTLLPLGAGALIWLLDLEPSLAAGAVVVTAAPGGGISNILCSVAGANTALSVTLTAIGSLVAIVTLPILISLGFEIFLGHAETIEVPVAAMMGQLFLFVLLPIGLGMWIRLRRSDLVKRWGGRLRQITLGAVGLLIMVSLAMNPSGDQAELMQQLVGSLFAGLLWTLMAMGLGFALGRAIGLDGRDSFTLLIEFSVKNGAMAAIIAIAVLGRAELAVFLGAYIFVGYPLAALLCFLHRRRWGSWETAGAASDPGPEGAAR